MRNEDLDSVAASPEGAQALERLWNRCHESGEHGAAIEALGRAIAADGSVARYHYMLGCALQDAGRVREAADAFRKALSLEPGLARAQNNLGCLLEAGGDAAAAMQCYEAALRAEPGLANALYNRGNLNRLRGHAAQAQEDIGRALALEPQQAAWRCVLGEVLVVQWKLDAAAANYRAVLEVDPGDVRARFGLGNSLLMMGRPDEAETCFRRAIAESPNFVAAHSNLLLCLHYRKGDQGRALYEEHIAWAKRHAGGIATGSFGADFDRSPARPLNVGYVSPNFEEHSVASFLEPLLATHDRAGFRIFCYSNVANPDPVTRRLSALCDVWRDIHRLGDDEAARLIREDRIDILIDLAGHTGGARPLLFARGPAPVQATWLGYPDTTGLERMDYRITDADADPEGEADARHSERLLRLATGFLCFAPHADSPQVALSPVFKVGHITFGCFNSLPKVTPELIALWSKILAGVPRSRLVLKAHALDSDEARRAVRGHFERAGVDGDKVELRGPDASSHDHLARYGTVDIALDTYPYHGTTTSCEALWMGVPVVSLAGRTHVSRVGVSILARVGLSELVAASPDEYVMKAIALARDPGRLRELRGGLRERMRASPLLDSAGFARGLEAAYRQMWARWRETG